MAKRTESVPSLTSGVFKHSGKMFELDEQKLRKIVSVIQESAEKLDEPTFIRFHVERANHTFYDTLEIDDVLLDDNHRERRVTLLGIA